MKILLITRDIPGDYQGVLLRLVERALKLGGIDYDIMDQDDNVRDYPYYDLYLGVGDELMRRQIHHVIAVRAMGGVSADFRALFLPPQPRYYFRLMGVKSKEDPDFVFTHFKVGHRRAIYVGHGVNDEELYPDQSQDQFTVLVDHSFKGQRRRDKTQFVLDQCRRLKEKRPDIRIWYHCSDGMVEDKFDADMSPYAKLPFDEITSYYRKTHIFLPTHRETQGMLGAEIGMCGGLTLMQKYMYPSKRRSLVPHQIYDREINWPETIDIEANRKLTDKHFGIAKFSKRLSSAVHTAVERSQGQRAHHDIERD